MEAILSILFLVVCLVMFKERHLFSIFVLSFFIFLGSSNQVLALNKVTGSVQITASIKSVCYIVVNQKNQITEILTNTRQQITPVITLNTISGSKEALSPGLSAQYKDIIKNYWKLGSYGIIYKINLNDNRHSFDILSIISKVNVDNKYLK